MEKRRKFWLAQFLAKEVFILKEIPEEIPKEVKINVEHRDLNTNEYLNTINGISVRLYFTTSILKLTGENYKLLTDKQQRKLFLFLQKAELNFSLTVIINTILSFTFKKKVLKLRSNKVICGHFIS